jgi:hypothetical protein
LELSRDAQLFVALDRVAVAAALVTCASLPVVTHPLGVREIWVVSGLVPPVVRGGSKVMDPVTSSQVMAPVAIAPPGCVVGAAAVAAVAVVAVVAVVEVVEVVADGGEVVEELEHAEARVATANVVMSAGDHRPRRRDGLEVMVGQY